MPATHAAFGFDADGIPVPQDEHDEQMWEGPPQGPPDGPEGPARRADAARRTNPTAGPQGPALLDGTNPTRTRS